MEASRMHVTLTWDDTAETIMRWQFSGWIGLVDYIQPINETARLAIFAEDAVDAIIDTGWRLPFPNRPFKYLRQAILAAPPSLRLVVIASPNPFTRWVIALRLTRRYPELAGRLAVVNSLAAARGHIAAARAQR
jgi:hypothetical protein